MLAVKNSRKRRAAESTASAMMAGTVSSSPVGPKTSPGIAAGPEEVDYLRGRGNRSLAEI
jgi:hypothetical protein